MEKGAGIRIRQGKIPEEREISPTSWITTAAHWYRTTYSYTFRATGRVNYLYDTYDREEDLRLYVDAAGNIWDEKESGIL